ncbi:hypothetical protein LTSEWAN_4811, partial [Salmonella enterica subsp. enterica serovar Wandsworth str. A4-580]
FVGRIRCLHRHPAEVLRIYASRILAASAVAPVKK